MNGVPEQVGVVRLARAAVVDVAAEDLADLRVVPHADEARTEAVLRAGEQRRLVLPCQPKDLDRVGQGGGQRPADVDGLAGPQHRLDLLQMSPAVEAHDQDGVALRQELVHGIDERDLVGLDVLRPLRQLADALLDVRAAGGIGRDHADAGQVPGGLRIVEELRERNRLVVVQPQDADLDGRRLTPTQGSVE